MARPKGAQNIRTLTSLRTDSSKPHHKLLRLTILSMEKSRREKEAERAREVLAATEHRLAEIAAESARIVAELGEFGCPGARGTRAEAGGEESEDGFPIRY